MFTQNLANELFKIALGKGADFADIYVENTCSTNIICEENKIEYISSGTDKGLGIRFLTGEKTLYASSNDFSPKKLRGLSENLLLSCECRTNKEKGKKKCLDVFTYEHLNNEKNELYNIKKLPDMIPIDEKIKLVNLANKAARKVDVKVKQVKVICNNVIKEIIVANSFGLYNCEKRIYTTFLISVVASDGKIFVIDDQGMVYILRAGAAYELLGQNDLGEICMATPAISGNSIFFRTINQLIAVTDKP